MLSRKSLNQRLFGKYPKRSTRYPIHTILTPDPNPAKLYNILKQAGYTRNDNIVAMKYTDFLNLIYEAHANKTKWFNQITSFANLLLEKKPKTIALQVAPSTKTNILKYFEPCKHKIGSRKSRKAALTVLLAKDFERLNALRKNDRFIILSQVIENMYMTVPH